MCWSSAPSRSGVHAELQRANSTSSSGSLRAEQRRTPCILRELTPNEFVEKWKGIDQKERSVAHSHFNDLCVLLDEPTPLEADPAGEWYAFEKGAQKTTGSEGWADVWKKGCFAWEYKGKHKDLDRAYVQLQQYAIALQNPPLLVVCDIDRIRIVTNWTNTVSVTYGVALDDLVLPAKRQLLKDVFNGSERLRTGESRAHLTAKVARTFGDLAQQLQKAGHEPLPTAHFINRLVFCLFAEDIGILPNQLFSQLLKSAQRQPEQFPTLASNLFDAMREGGFFGADAIDWFNGGLFDDHAALPLSASQLWMLNEVAANDWSAIDPSIFGTLFERGLDPSKRSQLGAHYTDPQSIMRIVEPVVLEPMRRSWSAAKVRIEASKSPSKKRRELVGFLNELRGVQVLDPACGSGNFLYLALQGLKDLELVVLLEAEGLGLGRSFPELGPECVKGIELSPFAAELARVTVWIGEIQWQLQHGYSVQRKPILRALDTIENRDALVNPNGTEAVWPEADYIIGNPPFIGDKRMREELGDEYVDVVRRTYSGRVSGAADFVCFWFDKAGLAIREGRAKAAGLVATNKIRKGRNNDVLRRAIADAPLFDAWSDFRWHDEKGAAVRVSLVSFAGSDFDRPPAPHLDGVAVRAILPDLTARTDANEVDLGEAVILPQNRNLSFNGVCLAGDFDVPDDVALGWLLDPNPSGRPNSDVLRPLWNGRDLTDGWRGRWAIDFGPYTDEPTAARYAAPFRWVEEQVKPVRLKNNRKARKDHWWRHGEARPGLRTALVGLSRILVTPETTKHRWFRWLSIEQDPDHALIAIAREDDFTFGILSSRFHEVWMLGTGNRLGVGNDPRYNHTRTLQTFPFPALQADDPKRSTVEEAARELDGLRESWMKPAEWMREQVLEFPATVGGPWSRWIESTPTLDAGTVSTARYVRQVPHPGARAMVAARTMTRLYNELPAWLRISRSALDIAVADAYGLDPNISDVELLQFLYSENVRRQSLELPSKGRVILQKSPTNLVGLKGGV